MGEGETRGRRSGREMSEGEVERVAELMGTDMMVWSAVRMIRLEHKP